MKKPDKLILCYVTDRHSLEAPAPAGRAGLSDQVEKVLRAGVDWIQIREKDLPARELMDLTRSAIRACDDYRFNPEGRILVNDRCDVAWAAGAHGVHLGEKSLPISAFVNARPSCRRSDFIVGASSHSLEHALKAANEGADYLFFGPIFATPSKEAFGPPQGVKKLAEVCASVAIPVIAIGGITAENAEECRHAGAAGIAAIRLFQQSRELANVVKQLRLRTDSYAKPSP